MKWSDNYLFEDDAEALAERAQLQLAMYAIHLSTGHSIYCKSIKVATIEQYLLAASSFLAHFSGRDFRRDSPTDSFNGVILQSVIRDLKKYETVPNRREPYNLQMH